MGCREVIFEARSGSKPNRFTGPPMNVPAAATRPRTARRSARSAPSALATRYFAACGRPREFARTSMSFGSARAVRPAGKASEHAQRTPFGQRPIVVRTPTATMKPIHIHVIHVGRSLGGWGMVISNLFTAHILSYAIGKLFAWDEPSARLSTHSARQVSDSGGEGIACRSRRRLILREAPASCPPLSGRRRVL